MESGNLIVDNKHIIQYLFTVAVLKFCIVDARMFFVCMDYGTCTDSVLYEERKLSSVWFIWVIRLCRHSINTDHNKVQTEKM